jgi:CheY-like chemotaxis protein
MEPAKAEKKRSVYTHPKKEKSRRVLVVDDERSVQDVLSELLYCMGFEVALADDGVEALAIFIENSFDLVLTDLQMPIMDGSSLAHLIKERSPNTPVVLLTGADKETVRNRVKSGCIDSVIFKPFLFNDFQNTVQRALELKEGE